MLEFREDAPMGALIFWSIALAVWIVIKIRSRSAGRGESSRGKPSRKGKKESPE